MWWEVLQAAAERALAADLHDRAERLKRMAPEERDRTVRELEAQGAAPAEAGMTHDEVSTLAAEHDIGFHTRRHDFLPELDDDALDRALRDGREELEALIGRRLDLLAYPHGGAGEREAWAARNAGFRLAFTTQAAACNPHTDPLLVGRAEIGEVRLGSFLRQLSYLLRER